MRYFENPSAYFFRQAEQPQNAATCDALAVQKQVLSPHCPLCLENYNFIGHLPRVLIHCGHTFCQSCLTKFHRKRKVRCPQCHKLVKQLEDVKMLPINHTIFRQKVQQLKTLHPEQNFQNADEYLLERFQEASRKAKERQAQPQVEPQTGLPFCLTHTDRVEHFFCMGHRALACRACGQLMHQRDGCSLIELYDVGNIESFLAMHSQPVCDQLVTSHQFAAEFFEEDL